MKLIGRMPQDSWGKILQILLDGKTAVCASVFMWMSVNVGLPNSKSWGFMDTMCMRKLWHTNTIQSCVNEQER